MIDAKRLFDKIREIKGNPLTQAEVDAVNAILQPVMATPQLSRDPMPHPKLSVDVLKAAQLSQLRWNIPSSVSLAQFALESGWGQHMPAGSNNPFGIKARVRDGRVIEPFVSATTREQDFHGQANWTGPQPFRKFGSIAEAFDYHGQLLATGAPYEHARTLLPDADSFADALTGVYATDRNYGTTLKSIMRSQGLYAYNAVSA